MKAGGVQQRHTSTRRVSGDRAKVALSSAGMGVWDWNPITGKLFWDDTVARLHGLDPSRFDGRMETFLARVHPDDREALQSAIAHALLNGGPYAAEFRVVKPDGTTGWVQGRGQAILDESGVAVRMVGVAVDTTALRSTRERAGRSLDHIGDGLALLDRDWRVAYLNDQAANFARRARAEIAGKPFYEAFPEARNSIVEREFTTAMRTQQPTTFEAYHAPTDAWLEFRCFPAPDGLTLFFHDITERREAERERERLLAAEQESRAHQRMLADASQQLSGSLDHDEVIATLTRLAVPALAEWVVVDILEGNVLQRVAVAHADRRNADLAQQLAASGGVPVDGDAPPARVLRTGLALLAEHLDDDLVEAFAATPALREVMRSLGAETGMVLPLISRGHGVGVLSLFSGARDRQFDSEDLTLAEQLASRAALALDNAALYRREHQVADALQRAVLPERLPEISGYELAARYVPAVSDVKVAGDWYDAFPTGRGTFGLAVGDVAGHGLTAASLMGQLRNALRAYAVQAGPGAVLTELSDLLDAVEPEAMATVVHGELDTSTGILWWASAGHPPPLFVPEPGVAALLEPPAELPVSAIAAEVVEPVAAHELWLEPGNVLVWYTDGLVERRDDGLTQRLEALRLAGAALPRGMSADGICDRLITSLLDRGDSPDDVCILVLRRLPA